jgi:glycosyltransferase involved in cell wall biosynthesis
MNPEYLVAAGWLWRILRKRTVLWYTHKSVDLKLHFATLFANAVITASKESFRLKTKKLAVVGHGIDTEFFSPDLAIKRGTHFLSVGRLMKAKRHDLAIERALQEDRTLRIAGSGPERPILEAMAATLGIEVEFLGGINQAQLRDEYRQAAYLIHTSETGSLDKVVLEALACGLPIQTNDPALKYLESEGPEYVRANHSLPALIPCILEKLRHD